MRKNGIEKVYGEIMETFERHSDEIVNALYPGAESIAKLKRSISPTLLGNYGGPSSTHFKLCVKAMPDSEKERSFNFFVRYYSEVPKTYKGKHKPWEVAANSNRFLREAGVTDVPVGYLPNGSKILFLEWIEGRTLIEHLKSLPIEQQIAEIKKIFLPLATYQHRASVRAASEEDLEQKVFYGRPFEEKAKEYFTKTTGKAPEEAIRAYKLIEKAHHGFCVVHGDLGHTNIILDNAGNPHFIDQELEFGDGYNDLGSLFGYLGMDINLYSFWPELGERFGESKLEVKVIEFGGIPPKEPIALGEAAKREMMFKLFASAFHKSFKILAKNQLTHLYDEKCEKNLKGQMLKILAEWIANSEKFGLDTEDIEAAKILLANCTTSNLLVGYEGNVPSRIETPV